MARPKKSPRERFQITLPRKLARDLRAHAKRNEIELSTVVALALGLYLPGIAAFLPEETLSQKLAARGILPRARALQRPED